MQPCRLGFVINPIAGMGGSVGLKGTDGVLAQRAAALGARPVAAARANRAMAALQAGARNVEVLTCSGDMGENAVRAAGLPMRIVYTPPDAVTAADDTLAAAEAILQQDPELILFVGGDGTARDLLRVIGDRIPVLGVPSGVKMHSAVFAASATAAGHVAQQYLASTDRDSLLDEAEIMDRDPSDGDRHSISPRLYGTVRVPRLNFLVPAAKASSRGSDMAALEAAVQRVAATLDDDRISLIGPGSTMRLIKRQLGIEGTPLGIDAFANGECVGQDLNEQAILQLLQARSGRIVVSVVGGQGFLFGRGNQQLSPQVIRAVGTDNVVVVASLQKLTALPDNCLLLDTGDDKLDAALSGHIPVVVSGKRTVIMPVRNASGKC